MLNINVSTVIFQIINFLILAFLLYKFLFRRVMRLLDERAKRVTRALDEAEKREKEAETIQAEYLAKMEDAKREMEVRREAASEEMERTRREVIEQARAEVQALRARAEEEVERERMEAVRRHREELATLVTSMSARMLTEVGDGRLHGVFFDAFLDRLARLEPESLRRQRDMGEMRVIPVEVISADPLSEAEVERLEQVLSSFLEKEVRLDPRLDPSLIGGAIVRFGDHLIDGSLRGQLARLRERFLKELAER